MLFPITGIAGCLPRPLDIVLQAIAASREYQKSRQRHRDCDLRQRVQSKADHSFISEMQYFATLAETSRLALFCISGVENIGPLVASDITPW